MAIPKHLVVRVAHRDRNGRQAIVVSERRGNAPSDLVNISGKVVCEVEQGCCFKTLRLTYGSETYVTRFFGVDLRDVN